MSLQVDSRVGGQISKILGCCMGNPRFPLKGSSKGDIDMDVDVEVIIDSCFWVAAKEFNLSYQHMDKQ